MLFILRIIGRHWETLLLVSLSTIVVLGFNLWLAGRDKRVLLEYVQEVERTTSEALAAEKLRQEEAAKQLFEGYKAKMALVEAEKKVLAADLERQVTHYENLLVSAKRDCRLDRGDLDHILQLNKKSP